MGIHRSTKARSSLSDHEGIRLGLAFPPRPPVSSISQGLSLARTAGLTSFTVWDHLVDFASETEWVPGPGVPASPHENLEYQTLLGYLAGGAGDVRIGVGVTEAVRRHPVIIAQAALTLSHVLPTRPILGIGAGEAANTVPYGMAEERPVGRLEEALAVIRACLCAAGPISLDGDWFPLDGARLDLGPGPGSVPEIWVGGRGPRMLRLAGEFGDGWYPTDMTDPDRYGSSLATVREHARRAGRDATAILPAVELALVLADRDDEARRSLDDPGLKLLGLLLPADDWDRFGGSHPLGENHRGFVDYDPFALHGDALRDALNSVPTELMEEIILWGTPERAAERIRALGEAGLRHAVVSLAVDDVVGRRAWTERALREMVRLLSR